MGTAPSNLADLKAHNHRLQETIAEARQHLDGAATRLREVLDEQVFVAETPLEVEFAMRSAADAIATASGCLQRSTVQFSNGPTAGGPTRQQGQFLAYIREYMLLNRGVAPTHAELQRFFRITPPSVNSMLKRLDEKGYIRRTPGKPRAIELTIDPALIPTLDHPLKQ